MPEIYFPSDDSYILSEVISEQILKLIKNNNNLTFLEIGSGSGIQLQTALEPGIKKQNIFSLDINSQAVAKCKKLGFNCIKSDLFEEFKGKADIIVFNPPYLPEDLREPKDSRIATTGGEKGSEIINEFLKQAKKYLEKEGRIFLLTSSKTKGIDFLDYKKKILKKKNLFFEELIVWELK
jgi:release factor glutamine methyltransferase